jgi:hypothetical protein
MSIIREIRDEVQAAKTGVRHCAELLAAKGIGIISGVTIAGAIV